MKTIEAITAFHAVQKLINDPTKKSPQLSYALIRNRRVLSAVVDGYNAKIAANKDDLLEEMLGKWREIAPDYASRDEAGAPISDPSGGVVIAPERVNDYNKACEAIMLGNLEYKVAFDLRSELISKLQDEDVEVTLYPISLKDIPSDTDFEIMELLFPMIEEG